MDRWDYYYAKGAGSTEVEEAYTALGLYDEWQESTWLWKMNLGDVYTDPLNFSDYEGLTWQETKELGLTRLPVDLPENKILLPIIVLGLFAIFKFF